MSRILLVIVLGIVCFTTTFAQDYSTFLIPEDLKHNSNAVVRKDQVRYEMSDQDKFEVQATWAITVFNKDGLEFLYPVVGYSPSVKVKKVEAVIYDRKGERVEKFRERDFHDISAVSGGTLYSESRRLYLDYTPVSYPFTMEFSYEVTTANTSGAGMRFLMGYDISSERAEFEMIYAEGLEPPRIREMHLEGLDLQKEVTPGRVYYAAKNIKAIKDEYMAPEFGKIAPQIEVAMNAFHHEGKDGYGANWEEIGAWMYADILSGRQEISEATKQEIRALTDGVDDVYEKSKIVYNYVQDQTRYISVQVGIGGIQPIAAIDVDEVKYGDCKGLTNYTIALLKEVGVEAYYVHVESGAGIYDFPEDFATLGAGDHVILAIPYNDDYIWSDCTSKIHPFGFLGDFTDNRNVLVITPEGGKLGHTAAYLDHANGLVTKADCHLTEDGALKGKVSLTATGIQYDRYFSKWEMTRDEQDIKNWYSRFWSYLNGFTLNDYSYDNNKDEVVLKEDLEVEVQSYMSQAGDQLLMHLNAFNRKIQLPDRYRNRKLPFHIKRGFLDQDEYTYHLPEGYRLADLPASETIESEFGIYEVSCSLLDAQTVVYRRSLLLKSGAYPKDKYKDFRAFMKKVNSLDNAKVLLLPDGELAEK